LKDENVPWPRSSIIYNIDDITKKNPEPIAVLQHGFWNRAQDYYSHEVHHAYDFREDIKVNPAAKGTYSTTLFQKKAIDTISQHNQSKPLFLFVPF
jgi:phosphoglycerol transferase MdoB-like AlkP superfamily enzyme